MVMPYEGAFYMLGKRGTAKVLYLLFVAFDPMYDS